MIKKLLIRLLVAVGICGLFLSMIFIRSIKPAMLKAYSLNETNYNGYSFQFDKSLYYDDNTLENNVSFTGGNIGNNYWNDASWVTCNFDYSTGSLTFRTGGWAGCGIKQLKVERNTQYTFLYNNHSGNMWIGFYNNDGNGNLSFLGANGGDSNYFTFTSNSAGYFTMIFENPDSDKDITIDNIMLIKGDYSSIINPLQYRIKFKFGYHMGYSFFITNNSSQVYNNRISINDASSSVVPYPEIFSDSCYIPVGQQEHCYSGRVYFPFDIDENGYVFSNRVFAVGIPYYSNLSIVANDSGLFFEPVFQGTLKNGGVADIYSKYIYTYNSYLFNSFQTIVTGDSVNSQLALVGNDWDKPLTFNENVNNINYITDWRSDTSTSNSFPASIFNQLYQFSLSYGRTSYSNSVRFGVSFSGINLLIVDDTSGGFAPVPGGNYENYNTCSAWYDIPCQAGNALTYVIYNAPIISPIVSFISGFVFIIQKFVELIQVFASLGVIFYIFILLLFLYILTKFSK